MKSRRRNKKKKKSVEIINLEILEDDSLLSVEKKKRGPAEFIGPG